MMLLVNGLPQCTSIESGCSTPVGKTLRTVLTCCNSTTSIATQQDVAVALHDVPLPTLRGLRVGRGTSVDFHMARCFTGRGGPEWILRGLLSGAAGPGESQGGLTARRPWPEAAGKAIALTARTA